MDKQLLKTLLALGLLASFFYSHAQVDVGALQHNLEKQFPGPSPLSLPEPHRPAPVKPVERQENKATSFQLEGGKSLDESKIKDISRP